MFLLRGWAGTREPGRGGGGTLPSAAGAKGPASLELCSLDAPVWPGWEGTSCLCPRQQLSAEVLDMLEDKGGPRGQKGRDDK